MNSRFVIAVAVFCFTVVTAAATAMPDECNVRYNEPPHAVNEACKDPTKPYCVRGFANSFCSECSPEHPEDFWCACPAGMSCGANRSDTSTFGKCTSWPKQAAACHSNADCVTTYYIGNVVFVKIAGTCVGGRCAQCNPYYEIQTTTCSFGVFQGHDRTCSFELGSGMWKTTAIGESVPSMTAGNTASAAAV